MLPLEGEGTLLLKKKIKKYSYIALALLLLFLLGGFFGYRFASNRAEKIARPEITSEVIVNQLKNEGFLVTQSSVLFERVTIEKKSGNAFRDFFLGQTVNAEALMQVDSGINLLKLTEDNIKVTATEIRLTLPEVESRSVELMGSINLVNNQGIVKKLIDDEDGYNEAIILLKDQARATVESEELRSHARAQAKNQVERLVRLFETEKEVVVL